MLFEGGFQINVDDTDRLLNIFDGKSAALLIPLLGEKYRTVLTMYYIDEMALKEIAEATHQSKNTVAVQIHRGVEKLAILFRVDTAEQGDDFDGEPE